MKILKGQRVRFPSGDGEVVVPPDENGVLFVSFGGRKGYFPVSASVVEVLESDKELLITEVLKGISGEYSDLAIIDIAGQIYDAGMLCRPMTRKKAEQIIISTLRVHQTDGNAFCEALLSAFGYKE